MFHYFEVIFFQTYDPNDILRTKLELLNKTNMVDYSIDVTRLLHPDEEVPEVITAVDRFSNCLEEIRRNVLKSSSEFFSRSKSEGKSSSSNCQN